MGPRGKTKLLLQELCSCCLTDAFDVKEDCDVSLCHVQGSLHRYRLCCNVLYSRPESGKNIEQDEV